MMDQVTMDALLIFLKASQDGQFADWNHDIIRQATAVLNARTDEALQRMIEAMKDRP
jgi:hypothetical protein